MISLLVGAGIIIAIFVLIYIIRNRKDSSIRDTGDIEDLDRVTIIPPIKEIDEKDIVLALLTEPPGGGNIQVQGKYAILWNGVAGRTYAYMITRDSLEIAKGEVTSKSNVFKVRGLPLEEGTIYDVQVGDTKVRVPFTPPMITSVNVVNQSQQGSEPSETTLDVGTNVVPTYIEVIIGTTKIPLSECQIKIEPPGFLCKLPSGSVKPVMVVYNGPNAVNILM